jgi:hypothetical protein
VLDLEAGLDPETRERLEELESRVARLERALAQGMGGIGPRGDDCAITQKLVALKNEAELLRTRPLKILSMAPPASHAPPAPAVAPAPPAPAVAPAPPAVPTAVERADTLDRLGITGAFASLDSRLAEAAQAETDLHRRRDSFVPVMVIDEALIDAASAKPPPEKIEVLSHLEECHPNIMKKILMLWRTPELNQFLTRLIVDDRGNRAGFAPGVMTELLLLNELLDAAGESDRWRANARAV